jgi:hypothetical protein
MGNNWAPDMAGGSSLFWLMAAVIAAETITIVRLRAHGYRARRRRAPGATGSPDLTGLAPGERPARIQVGSGRRSRKGRFAVLAGMVTIAAAVGFEMRHHPAAPAATAPAKPNVTIINNTKVPAPVVHVFHFPLSGVDIVLIVALLAVMTAGVLINRAHARRAG